MSKVDYIITLLIIILTLVVAIVLDSGLIVFLGLLISGIILFGKNLLSKGSKKMGSMQIACYVGSIASIFFGTIWYIALSLGILSLVKSIELIKKTGGRSPKATMILSIIGIINCINIYISVISTILIAY